MIGRFRLRKVHARFLESCRNLKEGRTYWEQTGALKRWLVQAVLPVPLLKATVSSNATATLEIAGQQVSSSSNFGGDQVFDATAAPPLAPEKKIKATIELNTDSIAPGNYTGTLTVGVGVSIVGVVPDPAVPPAQQTVTAAVSVQKTKCKISPAE